MTWMDDVIRLVLASSMQKSVWKAALGDRRELVRFLRSDMVIPESVRTELALLFEGKLVPKKRGRGRPAKIKDHGPLAPRVLSPLERAVTEYRTEAARLRSERKLYGRSKDLKEKVARKHEVPVHDLTNALKKKPQPQRTAAAEPDETAEFQRWLNSLPARDLNKAQADMDPAPPSSGVRRARSARIFTRIDSWMVMDVWKAADGNSGPLARSLRTASPLSRSFREQLALLLEGKLVPEKRGRGRPPVAVIPFGITRIHALRIRGAVKEYRREAARMKAEGTLYGRSEDLIAEVASRWGVTVEALHTALNVRLPAYSVALPDSHEAAPYRQWLEGRRELSTILPRKWRPVAARKIDLRRK
jgi:hypothetical protein